MFYNNFYNNFSFLFFKDGMIPVPYTKKLEDMLFLNDWSLVQPILSSSYLGFGNGSLERDTEEIHQLLQYLSENRNGDSFALVGHSTGCQNAIHFMKNCKDENLKQKVKLIALQAPVSDREGAMKESNYEENIKHARKLMEDKKGDEMMPRESFWAPITCSRFLDLQGMYSHSIKYYSFCLSLVYYSLTYVLCITRNLDKLGADDFFSSDLTDEEMFDQLGHIGKYSDLHLLAAFSAKDEYVPDHVDKDLLLNRMCNAMNNNILIDSDNKSGEQKRLVATPLMLPTGNHNLSKGEEDASLFIQEIEKILQLI